MKGSQKKLPASGAKATVYPNVNDPFCPRQVLRIGESGDVLLLLSGRMASTELGQWTMPGVLSFVLKLDVSLAWRA